MTINYRFGSRPNSGYNYRDFVKHLSPHLPANDKAFYHNKSLDWRTERDIPYELFVSLCHWKSPRRTGNLVEDRKRVSKVWGEVLDLLDGHLSDDEAIRKAMGVLSWNEAKESGLRGVQVRTASVLLTAWNPGCFAVSDFKVLSLLCPKKVIGDSIAVYIDYLKRLRNLREKLELDDISLRQIELALWHYYPIHLEGKVCNGKRITEEMP